MLIKQVIIDMTHLEEITVYEITQTPDGYGGTFETLTIRDDAPTFASVRQLSGSQASFGAYIEAPDYQVICNYKDGFRWKPSMIIKYRYYLLKVGTVIEDVRLRSVKLTANWVEIDKFMLPSI
jgi:hypothetical protein